MNQTTTAYICPKDGHKVTRQTFGTENGRHTWWACTNPAEMHFFGLPAIEDDPEYTEAAARHPNLEPWPDESERGIMRGMIAAQKHQVTRVQLAKLTLEAIPATLISASLIIAIWISSFSQANTPV